MQAVQAVEPHVLQFVLAPAVGQHVPSFAAAPLLQLFAPIQPCNDPAAMRPLHVPEVQSAHWLDEAHDAHPPFNDALLHTLQPAAVEAEWQQ